MRGIAMSSGIVMGRAYIHKSHIGQVKKETSDIDSEMYRLDRAINKGREELLKLYRKTLADLGEGEASIFTAYIMMIEDREFIGRVKDTIREEGVSAEWALKYTNEYYRNLFASIDDDFLRTKSVDIDYISTRILDELQGRKELGLERESIVVSDSVSPSLISLDKAIGFLAESGARTSHASIIARKANKPYIVCMEEGISRLSNEDYLILDGYSGEILINPSKETIELYRSKLDRLERDRISLEGYCNKASLTKDGSQVKLYSNISSVDDVEISLRNGAEGVGLYRTEFLYMDRKTLPSEEEQFEYYRSLVEKFKDREVTIRTLDIGGDKNVDYLDLPEEENPYLGCRSIRFCLTRKDIFLTQLRAILRASSYGELRIMFPMISSIEELRESKRLLGQAKEELREEGIDFDQDIKVGMMVEVPSVAIQGDVFAREVDFFSIGTNDLIQYTLAVDRGNQKISDLYDEYHPSVLRLIKLISDYGQKEEISVGICGESSSNLDLIPLFLAMGIDKLSMNSNSILESRRLISKLDKSILEKEIENILSMSTGGEIKNYLRNYRDEIL